MPTERVDQSPLPLLLLSGMGADERLFKAQRDAFPQLIVPRWIPPELRESLPDYARRMARIVGPAGPCYVGGGSFGGFVAMEMARHLEARAVFLIGSVRSPNELPRRVRALRPLRRLLSVVPFECARPIAACASAVGGRVLSPATQRMLRQLADAEAPFIRWASGAVLAWQPSPPPPGVPVYQIHGERDAVLPLRWTKPDVVVPGAGHLLAMTHAAAVNEFLRSRMS
jgi:pimeloyl-ACP methyl ester carboxylesterase